VDRRQNGELRRLLVGSGAIRFVSMSGQALWGRIDRNTDRLGVTRSEEDPANRDDEGTFHRP
jgi:hypothetical protein